MVAQLLIATKSGEVGYVLRESGGVNTFITFMFLDRFELRESTEMCSSVRLTARILPVDDSDHLLESRLYETCFALSFRNAL